jgi:cytoskeletal protein CcmA (bactofilin family)
MWKREGTEPVPGQTDAPQPAQRATQPRAPGERATIGRSIVIRGEVTGDEDLLVQGRVEGSIMLPQNSVIIGAEGEVKADVAARVVTVEGRVEGNVSAEEQVILRSSSVVQGDISAPRVVLEDGARFRGGVDMGEVAERSAQRSGGQQRSSGMQPEKPKPTSPESAPAIQATP